MSNSFILHNSVFLLCMFINRHTLNKKRTSGHIGKLIFANYLWRTRFHLFPTVKDKKVVKEFSTDFPLLDCEEFPVACFSRLLIGCASLWSHTIQKKMKWNLGPRRFWVIKIFYERFLNHCKYLKYLSSMTRNLIESVEVWVKLITYRLLSIFDILTIFFIPFFLA